MSEDDSERNSTRNEGLGMNEKQETETAIRACGNCHFGVLEDYGYSNYTVEGTNFRCAKRLNPYGEFDNFYGEDKRLSFAEKCEAFTSGEALFIDCDHEEVDTFTPEQREIYDMDANAPPAVSVPEASDEG